MSGDRRPGPGRTARADGGPTLGVEVTHRAPDRRAAGWIGDGMPREALLAKTLVELADTLVADFDVIELLTLLTGGCVEVLDVAATGIMLVAPEGDLRVMASSSEAMRVLELFELQSQEGPCLDSYRTGDPVLNQ